MFDYQFVGLTVSQLLGLTGAATYSLSYFLIAFDRLSSRSPVYYLMQFAAASLVLVSLTRDFNIASLCIQLFFILVSVIGVCRHLKKRPASPSVAIAPLNRIPASAMRLGGLGALPGSLKAPRPCARPSR